MQIRTIYALPKQESQYQSSLNKGGQAYGGLEKETTFDRNDSDKRARVASERSPKISNLVRDPSFRVGLHSSHKPNESL